jgi:hypothetical protein
MTLGFLGTVIAAERAVGLGRGWAWIPALLSAAAAVLMVFGETGIAAVLLVGAGLALAVVYVAALSLSGMETHLVVMGLGAVTWTMAAAGLAAGRAVPVVVPALVAFLVLTICGERLELSRMLRPRSPWWRRALLGAALAVVAISAVSFVDLPLAARLGGIALIVLTVVSVSGDIARRTIRGNGVTRYMAAAMLSGYAWMLIAGLVWLLGGLVPGTPLYDVAVHTVLIGFVLSMVFAHAPVIVPAVLRVDLPYHPSWWAALGLLHVSLLTRVVGSLAGWPPLRIWGGVLNVAALALFAVLAVAAALRKPVLWAGSAASSVIPGPQNQDSTEEERNHV